MCCSAELKYVDSIRSSPCAGRSWNSARTPNKFLVLCCRRVVEFSRWKTRLGTRGELADRQRFPLFTKHQIKSALVYAMVPLPCGVYLELSESDCQTLREPEGGGPASWKALSVELCPERTRWKKSFTQLELLKSLVAPQWTALCGRWERLSKRNWARAPKRWRFIEAAQHLTGIEADLWTWATGSLLLWRARI